MLKMLKWSQTRLDDFLDAPYPKIEDFESGDTTRPNSNRKASAGGGSIPMLE